MQLVHGNAYPFKYSTQNKNVLFRVIVPLDLNYVINRSKFGGKYFVITWVQLYYSASTRQQSGRPLKYEYLA